MHGGEGLATQRINAPSLKRLRPRWRCEGCFRGLLPPAGDSQTFPLMSTLQAVGDSRSRIPADVDEHLAVGHRVVGQDPVTPHVLVAAAVRLESASNSRARAPAPGSHATPRRAPRPAAGGPPTPSFARRSTSGSSAAGGCQQVSLTFAACLACPASLVVVIVAETESKETESDFNKNLLRFCELSGGCSAAAWRYKLRMPTDSKLGRPRHGGRMVPVQRPPGWRYSS